MKWRKFEEKLNFGGRLVWVPMNPTPPPPPQSKLRDDAFAYGYLILSETASRQVASSGGGMWRWLLVRDDIGGATEPKLARPAAVEGGPTQRTAKWGINASESFTNSHLFKGWRTRGLSGCASPP